VLLSPHEQTLVRLHLESAATAAATAAGGGGSGSGARLASPVSPRSATALRFEAAPAPRPATPARHPLEDKGLARSPLAADAPPRPPFEAVAEPPVTAPQQPHGAAFWAEHDAFWAARPHLQWQFAAALPHHL
jgi:hypothetical protein